MRKIPELQAIKIKINDSGYMKLKSFHTMKETINKVRRQSTEWAKIHASYATLIEGYYPGHINRSRNSTRKNKHAS